MVIIKHCQCLDGGSIPLTRSIFNFDIWAHSSVWPERLYGIEEVASSNLAGSTKLNFLIFIGEVPKFGHTGAVSKTAVP